MAAGARHLPGTHPPRGIPVAPRTGRRPRVLPGVNVVGSSGGPAVRGRGGLVRAVVVSLMVTYAVGRRSGVLPSSVQKPSGAEFRYPRGAATCCPRRKWPPASWQPPVSLCVRRAWFGSEHKRQTRRSSPLACHKPAPQPLWASGVAAVLLYLLGTCMENRSSPSCPQAAFGKQSLFWQALQVAQQLLISCRK